MRILFYLAALLSLASNLRNRVGDLNRILLVSLSAPTGMTHRNMFNVVPRAFARSDAPHGDHFPSLNLKASYLIERAPDGACEIRSERVRGIRWKVWVT